MARMATRSAALAFQFHKGTIRTIRELGGVYSIIYFNSIKVRLEPDRHRRRLRGRAFQFHKGTIRTCHIQDALLLRLHFNSIKVRLELESFDEYRALVDDFNSIKVRLEQKN